MPTPVRPIGASLTAFGSGGPGDGAIVVGALEQVDELLLPRAVSRPRSPGRLVRAADGQGLWHEGLKLGGATVDMLAVPTGRGTLAVLCDDVARSDCSRAISSLRVTGAPRVPVVATEHYVSVVRSSLDELGRRRADAMKRLRRGRTRSAQAAALRKLAEVHRSAATDLDRLAPAAIARAPHEDLVTAVRGQAGRFDGLARAAERGRRKAHAAGARRLQRAEESVADGIRTLRRALDRYARRPGGAA